MLINLTNLMLGYFIWVLIYTTVQKFGVRFYLFSKNALNWSKATVSTFSLL